MWGWMWRRRESGFVLRTYGAYKAGILKSQRLRGRLRGIKWVQYKIVG